MVDLRTIILAAGKGTRMKSDVPKVLHNVCGKPIISYVLDVVKSAGSLKTYMVLGHKRQDIENYVGKGINFVEQKKLLGTADAVRSVEKSLKGYKGDILVLCGDTPLLNKDVIRSIVKKHRKLKAACTMLTAKVSNPKGYGRIIRDDRQSVIAIREEKDADKKECEINEINVGVYCFKSEDLFNFLRKIDLNVKKKEFYLTDIIELFSKKNLNIATVETKDSIEGLGVNSKNELAQAEEVIRSRILKKFMEQGITIIDPKTTYIDSDVKIGRDTVVRPFTFIEKDVKIGSNCSIGPFSRIRSQVTIGNKVTIGNFTELSRSKVNDGTIMKHFSYLGDSVVGSGVNIGAGTVTANFDGKNKNITKIESNAFIGCDSVLIAPVKIGKNSIVGAGSVVTKGTKVPAKGVVCGVPAKIKR